MKIVKKIFSWSGLGYALFLCVFTLLVCEIALRIYNPFPFRLKGSDVLLARNQRYIIHNSGFPGLDSTVVITKNNIGFEGPDPPASFDERFTVLTIGGSTTECWRVDEKDSWPHLLGQQLQHDFRSPWLNNAGMSGHSSWAHYLLIKNYVKQLRPKVIFMLVGWNEVGRSDLGDKDNIGMDHYSGIRGFLGRTSELYNLVVNIKRHYQYKEYGEMKDYPYRITRDHALVFNSREHDDSMLRAETTLVAAYKKRLYTIIDTCKNNGMLPILITQPGILGNGIEPITGCNLDDYKMSRNYSGKLFSTLVKMYNKAMMEVAAEKQVFCVDLAAQVPPTVTNYYDICHYNKTGCKLVAQIIYNQSIDYLKKAFPAYLK